MVHQIVQAFVHVALFLNFVGGGGGGGGNGPPCPTVDLSLLEENMYYI